MASSGGGGAGGPVRPSLFVQRVAGPEARAAVFPLADCLDLDFWLRAEAAEAEAYVVDGCAPCDMALVERSVERDAEDT